MKQEPARTFEDLVVWQEAHEPVVHLHRMTESFAKTAIYVLTSRLRRAAGAAVVRSSCLLASGS